MRYFFQRRIPAANRVLLIESGNRRALEKPVAVLRAICGDKTGFDCLTCYPGQPEGLGPEARIFRVADYRGRAARKRLFGELRARGYGLVGILCTGEPIMTKWKWAAAARLPAKVFLINENGDFFWLDYGHWRIAWQMALHRSGFSGSNSARALARVAIFPFSLVYLLFFAGCVHLRRKVHG